jgi:hypothetical protein
MSDAAVLALGPLEKRASRIISQAALHNLVQDMAHKVDELDPRLLSMENKLDTIMEMLRDRIQS